MGYKHVASAGANRVQVFRVLETCRGDSAKKEARRLRFAFHEQQLHFASCV